jgi:hypothetical protein
VVALDVGEGAPDARSNGYGLIGVPSHQSRSGPSLKIPKCRCAVSPALPDVPT